MYRARFLIVWLTYGLVVVAPTMAQSTLTGPQITIPEVTATLVENDVQISSTGKATFNIRVQVPPDHHGYLDKGEEGFFIPLLFTFPALETSGAKITTLTRPAGTWDDKVRATVLRGNGVFAFQLQTPPEWAIPAEPLSAVLRHQICNDLTNICYAPQHVEIPLRLVMLPDNIKNGATSQPTHLQPAVTTRLTLKERIANLFQQSMTNLWLAFILVFVAGLLASATPCVYPVIPITSAILMARGNGSQQRGRLHALVYFIGIMFFYVLLGFFASATGTALSTVMTSAWVNLGFAMVFAYFGLSMLGFYEFQFFSSFVAKLDTASSRLGGFSGTLFMGATAGLVISPCVGPVAGAILLDITNQTAATNTIGNPGHLPATLRGIILMGSFGAGLGIPFLLVGLLSNRLPQSGTWLTKVKWLLGLPILYFAYTYYLKGMETLSVSTNVAQAICLGLMAIWASVFIGAFHPLGEHPSRSLLLRRGAGIILLVIGVYFLYNGLGQSGILIQPSFHTQQEDTTTKRTSLAVFTQPGASTPPIQLIGDLRWHRNFSLAQQQASVEQKPLFVDFYATWCANCKAFQRLATRNTQLRTALQQAILVKIYDTDTIFPSFQRDQRYPELVGVGGQPFLPLFAIYSPRGEFIWKGQDYQAVETMVAQLERAKMVPTP